MIIVFLIKCIYMLRIHVKKSQDLIKKYKNSDLENLNNLKTVIEYSDNLKDGYKNIEE